MLARFPDPKGEDLVELRNRLGVSQKAIAKALGTTPKTLWQWETGRTRLTIPMRDRYEAAAVALYEARGTAA